MVRGRRGEVTAERDRLNDHRNRTRPQDRGSEDRQTQRSSGFISLSRAPPTPAADVRSDIHLLWHPRFRYYKRGAAAVAKLVEEYSSPTISGALGDHGEMMVLEGFARHQFVMQERATRSFQGREWSATGQDLDFIFERDGIAYGVEVKNTLGYMDQDELLTKTRMCQWLGVKPVIVARMLPKTWIDQLRRAGGFALILKYQLYPPSHKELASRVRTELGLPVDAPKRLEEGTMQRFLDWHKKHVN